MNVSKPKHPPTEPVKAVPPVAAPPPGPIPPLFRSIDWFAFGVTALLVFIGYWWTLAPDLTLEDSGELAVASKYAGVPHPPGYPVWTIYTWLFTKLPILNIAYRVGLSSAFAGALACGLVALMVSRGSSMMVEGIADLRNIPRHWENWICIVSGFVAGLLTGFNGFMWSQAVIVEVYTLSVLSLAGVMVCLMRWIYAPNQNRYLYLAFFWYGICFNNHQSLLVIALGLEAAIVAVRPKLGRDLFFWNTVIYVGGLVLRQMDLLGFLKNNTPLFVVYNLIGLSSLIAWAYLAFVTKKSGLELARDFTMAGTVGYLLGIFAHVTSYTTAFQARPGLFVLFNVAGVGMAGAFVYLALRTRAFGREWLAALASGASWAVGAAFYLYMPITSMTNPPLNWAYPRIVSGFFHALTRGQYEPIHPTEKLSSFVQQILMYVQGAVDEFNLAYLLVAVVPFFFWKRMQKRERAWLIGLTAIYLCLSIFLLILLNPGTDRQSRDLNKVFFTASHVMIAMGVGYGLTFICGMLLVNYERWRRWVFLGALVATGIGAVNMAISYATVANPLVHYTAVFAMLLPLAIAVLMFINRGHAPLKGLLALLALMPLWSMLAHWEENEQRGHLFGYWFGHDMFTPPFGIYPEMTRDAVLYGGTDPGRFNPTYMIFCESFIPPAKKRDPKFDRRDVYLITQNALADGTYLNYIRAHYNRSTQNDPGFFSELLRGPAELAANKDTNIFARMMLPVDRVFLDLGDKIEKSRRAGTSFFKPDDFSDLRGFVAKIKPGPEQDALSRYLYGRLTKSTQELVNRGGAEAKLRKALAQDLNKRVLDNEFHERRKLEDDLTDIDYSPLDNVEKDRRKNARVDKYRTEGYQLYHPERFEHVKISERTMKFMDENPSGHTLIRLNRILLEEAYPGLIAKSIGGVYPDREIKTATPEDSQRCFHEYLEDAQRRLQLKQLRPGEDVRIIDNRVQVSGQVAVMAINGLLTKVMFDKNPEHEFFVEESFPLDWMYPHLSPYGIIMKINRQPLSELTEEMVAKDHDFWSRYSERAIGNWITYDTPVSNICVFAERVYYRRDYRQFKGDPKFIRDSDGQKAFSKLRSSIAGVYAWRVQKVTGEMQKALTENNSAEYQKKNAEYQRMLKEAEFSFKQAYAFCPYSPEAIFRYINVLASLGRFDDAYMIARTSEKLDPFNLQLKDLISQLERMKGSQAALPPEQPVSTATTPQEQMAQQITHLEALVKQNSNNLQAVYQLAMTYAQAQQPEKAIALVDRLLTDPNADNTSLLFAAQICNQLNQLPRVEQALSRIAKTSPESPEVWFDLAGVQAIQKKETQAIDSLRLALDASAKRLAKDPRAPNLHSNALVDWRLNNIRQSPAFQRLIASNK
jgi:tetratricopeptide (TPR) repeat protein